MIQEHKTENKTEGTSLLDGSLLVESPNHAKQGMEPGMEHSSPLQRG